ncbi:MAG: GAF domain-containing protein [Deltaproteobacteria bacterium]|nr:GAF domain-containing protein [Deltaproteobacteria bacterium]
MEKKTSGAGKLSLEGKDLKYKLAIIEALLFVLPSFILIYLFYGTNVFADLSHLAILAFILLLILAGMIILRQIFDRFFAVTSLVKRAVREDRYLEDVHKDTSEMHEIADSFNTLMKKFEDTTAELGRRVFELFAIKELTEVASRSLDIEDLLKLVLEKAMSVTKAQIGSVFLVEHRDNRLRLVTSRGFASPPQKAQYVDVSKSLLGHVLSEKKPLLIQDIETDSRTRKPNETRYGPPSFLSVPIFARKDLIAVMSLAGKETGEAFDERDEQVTSIMIGEIGFALENARLHSSLEDHLIKLEERTLELGTANDRLQKEILERRRVEEALQQSQRQWETTFDAMSDWVTLIDLERNVMRSNRIGEILLGIPPREMIGRKCCELLHGTKETIPTCPLQRMLESRRRESLELHLPEQDRWVLITVDPVSDEGREIVGAVHIVRDMTEGKKVEEELIKTQKLESIGTLAGGIAHDFNNILTAIMGNISLAQMYVNPTDSLYRQLKEAEKATLRAKDLTHQFLTFSKGGEPIKRVDSIARVVRESTELALTGSNVKCAFELPEDLWPVEFDEDQIKQVVNSVITNARESMPEGGLVSLTVENRRVGQEADLPPGPGNYVAISIRDRGAGIPEAHLPQIFDPYFSTKERGARKGMGLGLTTAFSIVQKHGGHIQVESEAGQGTLVRIYLPTTEKGAPPGLDQEIPLRTGRGTILIMDDEEIVRDVAGSMLAHLGYDVAFAEDGNQALDIYMRAQKEGRGFDAVILDLTIPGGLGGEATVKKLLQLDPRVKAIATSGYSHDPVMTNYWEFGFKEVVAKPYQLQRLAEILRRVIRPDEDSSLSEVSPADSPAGDGE